MTDPTPKTLSLIASEMRRLGKALRDEHSKCDPPIANTLWNIYCQINDTFPTPSPVPAADDPSEPVAGGEPVNPYGKMESGPNREFWFKFNGWKQAEAAWRGYTASLRLALSQSQHEAETLRADLARLQSELAGVRESEKEPWKALCNIGPSYISIGGSCGDVGDHWYLLNDGSKWVRYRDVGPEALRFVDMDHARAVFARAPEPHDYRHPSPSRPATGEVHNG